MKSIQRILLFLVLTFTAGHATAQPCVQPLDPYTPVVSQSVSGVAVQVQQGTRAYTEGTAAETERWLANRAAAVAAPGPPTCFLDYDLTGLPTDLTVHLDDWGSGLQLFVRGTGASRQWIVRGADGQDVPARPYLRYGTGPGGPAAPAAVVCYVTASGSYCLPVAVQEAAPVVVEETPQRRFGNRLRGLAKSVGLQVVKSRLDLTSGGRAAGEETAALEAGSEAVAGDSEAEAPSTLADHMGRWAKKGYDYYQEHQKAPVAATDPAAAQARMPAPAAAPAACSTACPAEAVTLTFQALRVAYVALDPTPIYMTLPGRAVTVVPPAGEARQAPKTDN